MINKITAALGLGLVLTVAIAAAPVSQTATKKAGMTGTSVTTTTPGAIAAQVPFYPLQKCVVSGEALVAGEITDVDHEGRLVRLCCKMCTRQLENDPAAIIAKLDAAAIAAQMPFYPSEKCLISDEALGSMGDAIDMVHEGRLVRLCCDGCVKSFKKDTAKYFATIDRGMIAAQLKTYKATTCPVSGEPLGDGAVNHLYGTTLVRTCCEKCTGAVDKDPAKYLMKVASAK
ncbi:MAG: hypothetical protein ACI8QZ_003094 [Chlamydiales bacterium]|jgi:hypothetical protein